MGKLRNWITIRYESTLGLLGLFPVILRDVYDASVPPDPGDKRTGKRQKPLRRSISVSVSLMLVVLLAALDHMFSPQISFTLFYLLVVAYAAWHAGRKNGLIIAFASLIALAIHEFKNPVENTTVWMAGWNLGVQVTIYIFVVLLVSTIRSLTENLERRVQDRTAMIEREIQERKQTEEQLHKTMQQLRQLADNIADAFWMRSPGETRMVYVSPAYEKIWGRGCRELYQSPSAWLDAIHSEDRENVAEAMRVKQTTGEYNQEYRIMRPDRTIRWIRDRAFPIRDRTGNVIRIVGIAEDITDRRNLERQVLEITDREQARIGQDLHDSLCQKLVAVAFDNNSLKRRLAARELPEVSTSQQMGDLLNDAITEARSLARGLFPVQLDTDGLSVALQQLASSVGARFQIECLAHCPPTATVRDNTVATHLYRITQEAVSNAIKHANAKAISIELNATGNLIQLTVRDDGIGIAGSPNSKGGMGIHIMEYRARTIGGTLKIQPGENGGTIVACSTKQPPVEI